MKKILCATLLSLLSGSAIAQSTGAPAAAQSDTNKSGMTNNTSGGTNSGSTGTATNNDAMSKDGMAKGNMGQGGASKDGMGQMNKGGTSK